MYNKNTGVSRITALKKFLQTIPDLQNKCVNEILLDDLGCQYANLNPGEKWLNQYLMRIKGAIKDYNKYQKDPANFKPKLRSSPIKNSSNQKSPEQTNAKASSPNCTPPSLSNNLYDNIQCHPEARLQLRTNIQVSISGIPLDFSLSECKQLQALLGVYVKTDFEEIKK